MYATELSSFYTNLKNEMFQIKINFQTKFLICLILTTTFKCVLLILPRPALFASFSSVFQFGYFGGIYHTHKNKSFVY